MTDKFIGACGLILMLLSIAQMFMGESGFENGVLGWLMLIYAKGGQ